MTQQSGWLCFLSLFSFQHFVIKTKASEEERFKCLNRHFKVQQCYGLESLMHSVEHTVHFTLLFTYQGGFK